MAAVSYVPMLATKPGTASVDTKVYLYLDPGRLLERAVSMWDPHIGFGTVPHQTIGYLFPMGPFFWLAEIAGLPDWVAQRLWLGTLLFAAGLGTRFLVRTLGGRDPAATAAGFVYLLSPYALHYAAKHSIILAPWSGLPWLVALAVRALRRGGWRDAAWFAIVVQLVGGVNAPSLAMAGVGPLLGLAHAVWVAKEASIRRAVGVAARIGLLTGAASLWWVVGVLVQRRYAVNIVRYTETPEAVARASTPPEVLRQLGYWFFYGDDKFGPHVGAAALDYTQRPWLIVVGFGLTAACLVAAALVRWRHRAFTASMIVAGAVLSIGAYPWDSPPLIGRVLRAFFVTDTGYGMRSMPRALPVFVLGLALAAGAVVAAAGRRVPTRAYAAGLAVVAVAAANQPGLFTGRFVADQLSRPEDIPSYWHEAAAWLDAHDDGTRVLELPGMDFASYRWGTTVDPVTPGLMDRPYAARELVPNGTPPSADLLNALDRRLQEGVLDARALAPVARLMRAGHVVLRNDTAYERYRTARPRSLAALVLGAEGFGDPVEFGGDEPNRPIPQLPLLDEQELGGQRTPDPAQVVIVPVDDPVPIVRTAASGRPIVVAGDGEGLVDLAASGLIDGDEIIQYAALGGDGGVGLEDAFDDDAVVVVTDTNRNRGRRWSTVRENHGYTEPAGEAPVEDDLANHRLPLFPRAGEASYTVAEHRGGVTARASGYGNPVSFTPEDRPVNAIDGNPLTAWQVAAAAPSSGERLVIETDEPVTTDRVVLTQAHAGVRNRWITTVGLRFDEGETTEVDLDDVSRRAPGQTVTFDRRTFTRLEIEIVADTRGELGRYDGVTPVGFAEVELAERGPHADEWIRLPTDLFDGLGDRWLERDSAIVMTRARTDPANAVRADEEPHVARVVDLPTTRQFALTAEVRLSAHAPDDVIDRTLGIPPAGAGGLTVTSSSRLAGARHARGSAALDGDPATAWMPAFHAVEGSWIEAATPAPVTFDRLALQVVADGRHSLPVRLRIEADGGPPVVVDVPEVAVRADAEPNAVATVDVALDRPVTGRTIRVTIEAIVPHETIDYYSGTLLTLPVGIAELGLPGVEVPEPPARVGANCRSGLLTRDGIDVPLALDGTTDDLVAGASVEARPCGPDAAGVELDRGSHDLRSSPGRTTGLDVDRLVLRSAAGGAADPSDAPLVENAVAGRPEVRVASSSDTGMTVDVTGAEPGEPFWLEMGQSFSPGWRASIDGETLPGPELLGGYANAWRVEPDRPSFTVDLRFTPQRWVAIALAVSAATLVVCLALTLWPKTTNVRRSPRHTEVRDSSSHVSGEYDVTSPLAYVGDPPSRARRIVVVVGVGVGTLLVAGPVVALVTAALAAVAVSWRRTRAVLLLGGPASLLLAGAYVVAVQVIGDPVPIGLRWPTVFDEVAPLGWLALSLFVADIAVSRAWRR